MGGHGLGWAGLAGFEHCCGGGLLAPAAAAGAVASPQRLVTTTTTLTPSATSIARDGWVTFTAKVSAASGTPTGSVTFTDTSNGSILDSAALRKGTATFLTAALAPGSRSIVAHYNRGAVGDTPTILSKATGAATGSFAAGTAPAFGSSAMYTLQGGNLVAIDPSGSPDLWQWGNGTLVTAPVVNGGVVYVGGSDGTVYGISASAGKQVWSGTAGSTILGPDEQNADVLVGISVGGGLLVVPAGNALTAFGN